MNKSPLTFRDATESDCRLVWTWANDPALLAHTFRTHEPIPWETHQKWYAKTLLGTSRRLYIAEHDSAPAGYVRFEDNHLGEPEISVYLAPAYRGRHLSAPLLNDGTRHHLLLHPDPRPITAWVRIENAPSLASFRSAGWHPDPAPVPYLSLPALRFTFPG